MALHLYDSATRQIRPFDPLEPGRAGIYVCGPTVQSSPHVGHLRTFLAFDVLRRWMERSGYAVTMIRNVTDIDDKILAKSAEAGTPWWAHAYTHEQEFQAAADALGILRPTYEPRATGHVPEMIELVQLLIERGHAYAGTPGNVYFDVRSFPEYGALTNQGLDEIEDTEDAATDKRDPRDFALFKAPKPHEPASASWNTPWGRARLGWHLECSAMAHRYLGETFDIHGGGLDLRFPHHENEQAQSRAAGYSFARYWMHSAWVTQEGEKMSKSLGNFLLVSNVLDRLPAPVVRLALVGAHYRSMVEFTTTSTAEAAANWDRFTGFVSRALEFLGPDGAPNPGGTASPSVSLPDGVPHPGGTASPVGAGIPTEIGNSPGGGGGGGAGVPREFAAAMDDDLGTPAALAVIHDHVRRGNTALAAGDRAEVAARLTDVRAMLDVLGLDPLDPQWATTSSGDDGKDQALEVLVGHMLEQRTEARASKDWARADQLRDALGAAGVVVEDRADGASWHLKGN